MWGEFYERGGESRILGLILPLDYRRKRNDSQAQSIMEKPLFTDEGVLQINYGKEHRTVEALSGVRIGLRNYGCLL